MEPLSRWFENLLFDGNGPAGAGPAVITVTGSGGKTSLVWHLARNLAQKSERKILVTPTTKMLLPGPEEKLFDRYCEGPPPAPAAGVTLAGIFNKQTGKLEPLPPPELERITGGYDLVLIEGDGSRGLPLKGWAEYEPVTPPCTTVTAGVLPLWPLGMSVTEKIVHRLPLFCALAGVAPGEKLEPRHLAAAITGAAGTPQARNLFSGALGKKILFFNQIEDKTSFDVSVELARLLPPPFRAGLYAVIAGSVLRDSLCEL